MKKAIIITSFIILDAVVSSLSAQYSTTRVGVMPFLDSAVGNKKSARSMSFSSGLSNALFQYKFIKLIEQSESAAIMHEIELGMTGVYDLNTVVNAGKTHGIQIMIIGSIARNSVTGRAVDVGTSKVIATASVRDTGEVEAAASQLASGIETHLARENLRKLRNDSPSIALEFYAEKIQGATRQQIQPGKSGNIRIGDRVVFNFKSDCDGYITIVDIQPGGDVVVLYPNDLHKDNRVEKGRLYAIPSESDGFEITVSEPAGMDTVVAFFTRRKVEWLDRSKISGEGFWTVKKDEKLSMSRGFAVTATKLGRNDWESKSLRIQVEK